MTVASDDSKKGPPGPQNPQPGKRRLRDRLGSVSLSDAAELVVLSRARIKDNPVEHAQAAVDVTAALSAAGNRLNARDLAVMRRAVLLVARRDWTAAAFLAEALADLAEKHPDSVDWVGEAVARAVQADRTLARQLARVLPECAARIAERGPRLRVITALADLCRRHPGLGLAALPTVGRLLEDGTPEALASFLEEALLRASRGESVARSFLLRESRSGQEAWDSSREGLRLPLVSRTLQLYAETRLGRSIEVRSTTDLPSEMTLEDGAVAVTDGRTLYLAPRVDRFEDDERNFRLYKVATAHQLGRIEFGTFQLDPMGIPGVDPVVLDGSEEDATDTNPVDTLATRFDDPALARRVFLFAEDLRIDACLRRSYPGLARDLEELSALDVEIQPDLEELSGSELVLEILARWLWFGDPLPEGPAYARFHSAAILLEALRHPGAKVRDAAAVTVQLYRLLGGQGEPGPLPEQEPPPTTGLVAIVGSSRPSSPASSSGEEGGMPDGGEMPGGGSGDSSGPVVIVPADEDAAGGAFGESGSESEPSSEGGAGRGGRFVHGGIIPDVEEARQRELEARARSIQERLDTRGIPTSLREILAAMEMAPELSDALLERNLTDTFREAVRRGLPMDSEGPNEDGPAAEVQVIRYPEWDEQISDYRPNWCKVWERRASGNASVFVDAVLEEHRPMVRRLRREFQMLRPEGLGRERRATEGDDLDLDALVESLVDRRMGLPAEGRVHIRKNHSVRDVAVAFLVDLSASTRETVGSQGKSVIEVEKESLVVLSEALEALGDRYAIFGFSGRGRQMVTFDVFKDFGERLGPIIKGRIGAMTYRMENRDGAAIRHATRRLREVDARTRLLILLSDGKPLDCGCDLYQASYAQADTRMALREARNFQVHPFCITVDPDGESYLGDMYGDVRYTVIDSAEALPARLPAIYRRLTT